MLFPFATLTLLVSFIFCLVFPTLSSSVFFLSLLGPKKVLFARGRLGDYFLPAAVAPAFLSIRLVFCGAFGDFKPLTFWARTCLHFSYPSARFPGAFRDD